MTHFAERPRKKRATNHNANIAPKMGKFKRIETINRIEKRQGNVRESKWESRCPISVPLYYCY